MDEPQVVLEQVESMIHVVRGLRVILDEDIAALYEVDTRSLVRAMHRNQGARKNLGGLLSVQGIEHPSERLTRRKRHQVPHWRFVSLTV